MSTATDRADAIATLRAMLPPGSTVYTVLRSVSRSGMSRRIDCYLLSPNGPRWLSGLVSRALQMPHPNDSTHQGLRVGGCGMDMGYHLVYHLAATLYPDGFECTGERCPSNDHTNGDRDHDTPHRHIDGGYALRQEWI